MRTKLVICDLDGTLVDTAPDIAAAVNYALAGEKRPSLSLGQVRNLIGEGARATVAKALAQSRAHVQPDESSRLAERGAMDRLMQAYACYLLSDRASDSTVYHGVSSTLAALHAAGVKLALITNKEERFAYPLLKAHGLQRWFDPIVCGDTLAARKPDPIVVQHCLERHQLRPEHAVVVGDSGFDVAAAHAAGVRCLYVDYGYGGPNVPAPDAQLHAFAELLDHLGFDEQTHHVRSFT
ncbi:HAD-IA family hydrolase [Povalibacter sp.]|uniref:HAD-IA family hydrolase n=1 Tax=Povalibacter sp. TaxID=1962978 RepID=UPI002F3F6CC5